MAQADGVVANGTGSAVRSDINNQYAALWSNHSGSTEPSSGKVAYQLWADTNSGYLKIRNAANNAWIQLFKLDGTDICRLTGSTNNTITTVTSANNIQGEANLTFDGTTLAASTAVQVEGGSGDTELILKRTNTAGSNGNGFGTIKFKDENNNVIGQISTIRSTAVDDGDITFATRPTGGSIIERVRIDTTGDLQIADGDLVIGTAGHGIDFSAHSHASGMTSETLDSYEEGTFTPAYGSALSSVTYTSQVGQYTKVGNCVLITIKFHLSAATTSGNDLTLTGLPFTTKNDANKRGGMHIVYQDNWYSSSSSGTLSQVMVMFGGGSTTGYFYDGDGTAIDADEPHDSCRRQIHFTGMYFTD